MFVLAEKFVDIFYVLTLGFVKILTGSMQDNLRRIE